MKNVLLISPCVILAALLLFPFTGKAAYVYNDVEYAQKAELVYFDCSYVTDESGTKTRQELPHNVTVYSSNPDAELYLVHYVRYPGSSGNMASSCVACVSVGASTTVTCIVDDAVVAENKDLTALDMDYLNENTATSFYSLSSNYGVYRFKASKTNQQPLGDPVPHCEAVSGNVIDVPTDGYFGSSGPTVTDFVSSMDAYILSKTESAGSGLSAGLVAEAIAFTRSVMGLFVEFPLNVVLIGSLIGVGFGVFHKARVSSMIVR